jgi:uroporphyrinogen decarboxylase
MQTSRDVIDAMLRGDIPERVGFTDSPWGQTLDKWLTQGYPADENGKPVSPVDYFGFDLAGCGGWFPRKAKLIDDEVIEETDEWKLVKDGNGSYLKWWKTKAGTPEHVDFSMTSREVWEKEYREHLVGSVRDRVTEKLIDDTRISLEKRKADGKWTHYGHQFIWENMRGALGDLKLYESLLLDPDWIHDYCRVHTDLYKEGFAILLEEAGKPDGIWIYEDLGYKNSLFCSPEVYRELVFPYFKELVGFFHDYDLPVILHTCGLTEPIIDQIVDAGFDGLNPMEVKAGNDSLRIADEYADKLTFVGGLNAVTLESHDRDLIREAVVRLVEGMKKRKARYVFGSDHSLSTNIDLEDFTFAVEVYREHMRY